MKELSNKLIISKKVSGWWKLTIILMKSTPKW